MDINQLKYFISLTQTLSFTEAANRHFITQPAISHQITNLENELGVKLFIRTSHNVALTNAGKEFFPYALETLETLQSAGIRMRRLAEGHVGYVRVSGIISSSIVLSKCVAAFSRRYPDVQFDITLTSPYEEKKSIYEEFDFNFVPKEMIPAGNDYDCTFTDKDRLSLVVPKEHPLLDRKLDFSTLSNEPFITVSELSAPVLYNQVISVCKARNYIPRIVNLYNRAEAVLLSVAAGIGISILPDTITSIFLSDKVSIIPIEGDDTIRSSAVFWNKGMTNTAAIKFLDVILEMYPQT